MHELLLRSQSVKSLSKGLCLFVNQRLVCFMLPAFKNMHATHSCSTVWKGNENHRHFNHNCLWSARFYHCWSPRGGTGRVMKSVFSPFSLALSFSLCAGDALSSLKALRDAGRFVGKEDTVPLRLLYSRHNHSQITQDELSTRIKASASSDSTQVHKVLLCCEGGVCECGKMPLCLQFSILSIQPLPTCPHGGGGIII